ncbi:hypothetical protein SAMN04490357_1749 [Streptomyces misionensis]|uniref:Uncharacterized protein n=1 Tax=Streptomyces misionensis TaxID=67331 RepID=A0A1H4RNV1_9ACTN|nr:hypothetical protein [Streptomyces misionensis]SEC33539.1 hypothetical protein SAMN04490357_1749 [Streptomyces misionensis]
MDYTKSYKSQCDAACLHCGAALAQKQGAGRVKRFCTPDHGRLWRQRARALGFDV